MSVTSARKPTRHWPSYKEIPPDVPGTSKQCAITPSSDQAWSTRQLSGVPTQKTTSNAWRRCNDEQHVTPLEIGVAPASSVSKMQAELNWPTLANRRQTNSLAMMYRIVNKLVEIPSSYYLIPATTKTRGHDQRFRLPYCRLDIYKNSFFPSTIRAWNHLSSELTSATNLDGFKARVGELST